MKILHINTAYSRGGAALFARQLHNGLNHRGIDSTFLNAREPADIDKKLLSLEETKVRRIFNVLMYRFVGIEGLFNHKLWRKLEDDISDYDLIHLHNAHGYYLPSAVLEWILSKSCVWTLHDFSLLTGGPGYPRNPDTAKRLEKYFPFFSAQYPREYFDRSNMRRQKNLKLVGELEPDLVVPSYTMASRISSMGFPQLPTRVITHGLFNEGFTEIENRADIRRRLGWSVKGYSILFVAAQVNHPLKGLKTLLKAVENMPRGSSWTLYIVGEGNKPETRLDNNENIKYLGSIERRLVRECFRACDLYVNPTHDETFGLTTVEAIAEGVQVVCSDLPILREVTLGHAKYFRAGDSATLAKLIIADMNNNLSHHSRLISDEIRQNYSSEKMLDQYIKLYDDVIMRGRGNGTKE